MYKDDMSKTKLIAALATASLLATAVSVASTANAVQFQEQERAGRAICVATSTPGEIQITKNYFQAQLDQYDLLQAELRETRPEFAAHYVQFDHWTAEGYHTTHPLFGSGISAIASTGYSTYEAQFFAAKATSTYKQLQELAQTGFPVNVEYAPGWTAAQMGTYPATAGIPVVPIGGDWSLQETATLSKEAYEELTAGNKIPAGIFNVTAASAPNVQDILEPHRAALADIKSQYEAVLSPNAILLAAQNCQALILTGETGPTATVTPTVTVTAEPSTVTQIPEPVTSIAPTNTVVITPNPITTTVAAGTTTVTSASATTTVTAPQATVTQIPEPVTSVAPTETVVVTPAPVTTTTAPGIVTVVPPSTTVTAPAVTTTVTPGPVTSTAAAPTVTLNPEPVTITANPETETVIPEPVVTTAAAATTTVTPGVVTSTAEAPTVTVTVIPTTTQTTDPDENPGDGGNNFGMVAAIVAVLAAIGGIAAFFANNLGLFAAFF